MENNVLCQREEQLAVTGFFEEVSLILKECDSGEEKEKIKEIIHSMNDTISYICLGEESVGKTTLLRALFQGVLDIKEEMLADICEYRYGEQEFATQPRNGYQKRFVTEENIRGISVIDTKGLNTIGDRSAEQLNSLLKKCQVIFVVVEAGHVNSPVLWDAIEAFPNKNMIFFLTKSDLLSEDDLKNSVDKAKCYVREANISAPVFPVSVLYETKTKGVTSLEELRLYIKNQFVGKNPIIARQKQNIEETVHLLGQIRESFELRRRQYCSDAEILQKINVGLDAYVINQEAVIENLVSKVTEEIHKDIDAYQSEIISKIDPYKIKERFKTQQDFTDYLNMVNENYKNIMSDSVNRKTISAIKGCLHELEMVFSDAVGLFNERENILALNDKFYGSLAVGRRNMVTETKENAVVVGQFYKTLSEASETLFLQIWEERNKYEKKIQTERNLVAIGSGIAGAAGGMALANVITAGASFALLSMGATIGLVTIGVIAGTALVGNLAKTLYEPHAGKKMEEATQKCIEQFKEEVGHTKTAMIEQVSMQIRDIFKKELAEVDGYFSEFRMSVNIDERNIPLLESKIKEVDRLLNAIECIS